MSPLRSVGARLSLALVVVVAVALVVVYAIVVPRLERNLVEAKLDGLTDSGSLVVADLESKPWLLASSQLALDDFVSNAAISTNARVVVFAPLTERSLSVIADSRQTQAAADVAGDGIAREAAETLIASAGTVERGGDRFAEVAFPIASFPPRIMLFSAPLDDTLANVRLIKRRMLVAGALALAVALLLGYGGASLFARRIRRLERAAERIAGGRFDEPVADGGSDELGQLAEAFERMRGRLAQLENARREFIANASHELRTPLFSLGGFLELLTSEELDEATRREFLLTMREQVERLTKLATELLDLSRLDAGRLRVEREPVDLAALADAVVEEFRAVARATDHPLELVVPDEPVEALGDEQRVLQIGRALVENGLRHTPPGTPVRVRVARERDAALLAVEDEGGGILPEHRPQVFERFYRIDGSIASGSGLGLAIARELAHVMGGTLELESEPHRTTFVLRLPLTPAAVSRDGAGAAVPVAT